MLIFVPPRLHTIRFCGLARKNHAKAEATSSLRALQELVVEVARRERVED